MDLSELEDALAELLPGAIIDTDNNGQIIIYTDLMFDTDDPEGDLVPYEPSEEDEDFMSGDDVDQLEDDDEDDDE